MPVSIEPPGTPVDTEDEQLYCYGHPKTPTRLRCTRCDRPICGRCSIPASVGQHCPECVAEARKQTRKVRSTIRANAPAVTVIIALNILVYVAQQLIPETTFRFASDPIPIANGEWWRLLTAMFLHSPTFIFHILMNMYVLYIYGPNVEQAFGTARFVAMYLICGFTGSVTSYNLSGCIGGVGASGAIFGIAGVLLIFLYKRRSSTFVADAYKGILTFVGLNLAIGFIIPNIDNWAHIGGFLGGIALGAGFDDPHGRVPAGRQAAVAIAVVVVAIAAVAYRTATITCGPVPLFG